MTAVGSGTLSLEDFSKIISEESKVELSVLAEVMTVLQAVDHLECARLLSSKTNTVYTAIRKIFPKFIDDLPKYKDLERVKNYCENSHPAVLINSALPLQTSVSAIE